jgi:2-methylisocitrate lyase-like PEP mutase family enzyme
MLIYGNHAIRASVLAMQQVFAKIIAAHGIGEVDGEIASVEEIFRLQDMDRIQAQEKAFLR